MTNITSYDIAKESGYSIFTVSSALKNNPRIKATTKEKILSVAKKYNYRPSFPAQALAANKTNIIGVIMPEILHPFFGELVTAIEGEIHRLGYEMLLQVFAMDLERERKCLELLRRNKVDGLLIVTGNKEIICEYLEKPNRSKPPLVVLGYSLGENYVAIDRTGAVIKVVDHLVSLGHSCIGHAGEHQEEIPGKYAGYRMGLSRNMIEYRPEFDFQCELNRQDGRVLAKKIMAMPERPSAMIAQNDLLALGLMKGFREGGLNIPADIALVGYDDIEEAEFAEVPLTSVAQPREKMSQEAIEILMKLIEGSIDKPLQVLLEPELMIRQSTIGEGLNKN